MGRNPRDRYIAAVLSRLRLTRIERARLQQRLRADIEDRIAASSVDAALRAFGPPEELADVFCQEGYRRRSPNRWRFPVVLAAAVLVTAGGAGYHAVALEQGTSTEVSLRVQDTVPFPVRLTLPYLLSEPVPGLLAGATVDGKVVMYDVSTGFPQRVSVSPLPSDFSHAANFEYPVAAMAAFPTGATHGFFAIGAEGSPPDLALAAYQVVGSAVTLVAQTAWGSGPGSPVDVKPNILYGTPMVAVADGNAPEAVFLTRSPGGVGQIQAVTLSGGDLMRGPSVSQPNGNVLALSALSIGGQGYVLATSQAAGKYQSQLTLYDAELQPLGSMVLGTSADPAFPVMAGLTESNAHLMMIVVRNTVGGRSPTADGYIWNGLAFQKQWQVRIPSNGSYDGIITQPNGPGLLVEGGSGDPAVELHRSGLVGVVAFSLLSPDAVLDGSTVWESSPGVALQAVSLGDPTGPLVSFLPGVPRTNIEAALSTSVGLPSIDVHDVQFAVVSGRYAPMAPAAPIELGSQPSAIAVPAWHAVVTLGLAVQVTTSGAKEERAVVDRIRASGTATTFGPWTAPDVAWWGSVTPLGPTGPRVVGVERGPRNATVGVWSLDGTALVLDGAIRTAAPGPRESYGLENTAGRAVVVGLEPGNIPGQTIATVWDWTERGDRAHLASGQQATLPFSILGSWADPVIIAPHRSGVLFHVGHGEDVLLTLGPWGHLQWQSVSLPGFGGGFAQAPDGDVLTLAGGAVTVSRWTQSSGIAQSVSFR